MRWSEAQLAEHLARRSTPAPTVSVRARRQRKPRIRIEASENQIHEAVVDLIRARARRGVHWHHPATGELRDPITAAKLKRMGVRAGLPDLMLLIEGRLHGLELKRDHGGRVSEVQRAMHNELREAGAVIAAARGVDEAIGFLEAWGALLPINQRKATP